jgi:hypothetical protein
MQSRNARAGFASQHGQTLDAAADKPWTWANRGYFLAEGNMVEMMRQIRYCAK